MSNPSDPPGSSRRTFLCRAAGAGAATLGLALAAPPLVVLVGTPFSDEPQPTDLWIALGAPERFPIGAPPTRVVLKHTERDAWVSRPGALGAIWVQRKSDKDFLIHSTRCTHLGCAVTLTPDHFACPCHGATFALDGAVLGTDSPAKRPLDTLEWRLTAQGLEVRFQRFRLDTATKEALA